MNLESRYGAFAQRRRPPGKTASSAPRKSQRLNFGQASLEVKLITIAWLILVLDPHYWLASLGLPAPIVLRAPLVPLALLAPILAMQGLTKGIKYQAPLTVYACFVILTLPLAFNRAMAMPDTKLIMMVVIASMAVLTYVRRPPLIGLIVLTVLLYRYAWFGVLGIRTGIVPGNPFLGNQDGLGTVMATGLVSSVALAMAATERRLRHAAILTAVLCTGGLVSSFARGAFLTGAIGLGFLWYRATGRRLAFAVIAALVVGVSLVAGSFFSDVDVARGGGSRSFWTEISSLQTTVADPEEEERLEVWRVGWQVFVDNPILGVGSGSWAPYAADSYVNNYEVLGDRFYYRPGRIYMRAMHNAYLQHLAELGIVGTALFFWILLDYFAKNRMMRRKSGREDCSVVLGLRTRGVATAFEASMVAALATGTLYNMLGFWFFALIIAQGLFYRAWTEQREVLRRQEALAAQ